MTKEKIKIDAPEAARLAALYLNNLMPQAEGLLLEEVERQTEKAKDHWLVTLSFQINWLSTPSSGPRPLSFGLGKREYKTFTIDAATGEVLSMKIKTV